MTPPPKDLTLGELVAKFRVWSKAKHADATQVFYDSHLTPFLAYRSFAKRKATELTPVEFEIWVASRRVKPQKLKKESKEKRLAKPLSASTKRGGNLDGEGAVRLRGNELRLSESPHSTHGAPEDGRPASSDGRGTEAHLRRHQGSGVPRLPDDHWRVGYAAWGSHEALCVDGPHGGGDYRLQGQDDRRDGQRPST